ncbi:hypothetical protein VP01_10382g1, partial [Puccinia sorghi]
QFSPRTIHKGIHRWVAITPLITLPLKDFPSPSTIFGPFLKKDTLRGFTSPILLCLLGSSMRLDMREGLECIQPPEGQQVEQSYANQTMIDWAYKDHEERALLQQLDRLPGLRCGTTPQGRQSLEGK